MQDPSAESKCPIVLVDVDGTLLAGQSYIYFFHSLWRNRRRRVRLVFGLMMALPSHIARRKSMRRRLSSQNKWARTMAWILRGATTAEVINVLEQSEMKAAIRPEIVAEIRTRQQAGCLIVLASTAIAPVVQWLAALVGADDFVATTVEQKNGCYTGRLAGPICNQHRKIAAVEELAAQLGMQIDWTESWAYSDGIPDLPMLEKVGHPVAVEPDRQLEEVAQSHNWTIIR